MAGVLFLGLFVAAGGLFVFGFLSFAGIIADYERPDLARPADAIVALTGGAARISDAVDLLHEGRAGRLLITGVHPDTTSDALAGFAPGHALLFDCCVDLGYHALNTVGNAQEARNWARRHGFRRLIVVTSDYHLPRSLNEIRREMPEADLIAYPASSSELQIRGWWRNPRSTRLLMAEYGKYLLSIVRLRWRPATTWDSEFTTAGARH